MLHYPDPEGHECRYTWVQSRYFYCHFYQRLVQQQAQYHKLWEMRKGGTNLNIYGYDGYHVTKSLVEHYTSTERSFGHEMVLYTMLTVQEPKDYPWNLYYTEHRDRYPKHLVPECVEESGEGNRGGGVRDPTSSAEEGGESDKSGHNADNEEPDKCGSVGI